MSGTEVKYGATTLPTACPVLTSLWCYQPAGAILHLSTDPMENQPWCIVIVGYRLSSYALPTPYCSRPGTGYAATLSLRDVRRLAVIASEESGSHPGRAPLSAYAPAMRCPGLT
eukprot:1360766-Rhodomonas_salina.1